MTDIRRSRELFLWCMSSVYLLAFASLYVQIPGLYGDDGILPARLVIKKEAKSWQDLINDQPSLLRLTPYLGLDVQSGMDLLCLAGIVISLICLISKSHRDSVTFLILWILYFSLYQVGQTFMWFQWDILLLEAGFLTILVAPIHPLLPFIRIPRCKSHDNITMWLIKWLLFRLMFASGIVKLTSHCPTWWGLTALNYHYETQCIPTAAAWYAHQLPEWFQKLSVVATYFIEIVLPWLFFLPIRPLQMFAFWGQVLFQVLIMLTGNYNFFNLLTLVLCLSLLDDSFFYKKKVNKGTQSTLMLVWKFSEKIVTIAVIFLIVYATAVFFELKINWYNWTIKSSVVFSKRDLSHWLEVYVPYSIGVGLVSLTVEVFLSILRILRKGNVFYRMWSVLSCGLISFAAFSLFAISLVPHTVIEHGTRAKVLNNYPLIQQLYQFADPYQITNSYGLFRSMTGVGGRPEIIIEGSNDNQKWKPYEFLYKPGDVYRRPPFVAPHQPRLDWQMWFAALGSYQHNPWFLNLVYRLLTAQPEVLELMGKNPFPQNPPKYIRATLYHYHFSSLDANSNRYRKSGNWWIRKKKDNYLPPLTKDDPGLVQYMKQTHIIQETPLANLADNWIKTCIIKVRRLVGQMEGFTFTISLFLMANLFQFIPYVMS